jgi:hypothetical protein
MSKSETPKGVEHEEDARRDEDLEWVVNSGTPKGIEHRKRRKGEKRGTRLDIP